MKDSVRVVFEFEVGPNGRYDFKDLSGVMPIRSSDHQPWTINLFWKASAKATTASLRMIPIQSPPK